MTTACLMEIMSLATSKLKTTKEKGLGFSSVKTESCVNFNPFDPVPLVRTQLDYDDDEHEVNWHKKLFAVHFNLDRHMETKLKWSGCFQSTEVQENPKYLTYPKVSFAIKYNPQNSEMKFCENMKLTC